MPPPRQARPGEPLTIGDRFVTALLGGICGFGTALVFYFLAMYGAGRRGQDVAIPFSWTWIFAGGVSAVAFLAGPERTMDAFEQIWALVGTILFRRAPGSDVSGRPRKRK